MGRGGERGKKGGKGGGGRTTNRQCSLAIAEIDDLVQGGGASFNIKGIYILCVHICDACTAA